MPYSYKLASSTQVQCEQAYDSKPKSKVAWHGMRFPTDDGYLLQLSNTGDYRVKVHWADNCPINSQELLQSQSSVEHTFHADKTLSPSQAMPALDSAITVVLLENGALLDNITFEEAKRKFNARIKPWSDWFTRQNWVKSIHTVWMKAPVKNWYVPIAEVEKKGKNEWHLYTTRDKKAGETAPRVFKRKVDAARFAVCYANVSGIPNAH